MLGDLLLCAYTKWLCMKGVFPTMKLLALVRIMAVQLCSSKYWTQMEAFLQRLQWQGRECRTDYFAACVWGGITWGLPQLLPVFFSGKASRQDGNCSKGHELDLPPTQIKGSNQRSGSLTTYICSWSANAADSCEMPVCPTGHLKDLGLGCFAPSWWHLSISAVCFIAVKIQAVQPNVGCVLEYSQERRSIPGGFVFPLQSSLVIDVAWPRGSWRWSLSLPSQWAEKGTANYRSWQPRSLHFVAFLTLFSNRILSVCVLPAYLRLLRGQRTTCTWSQPNAGKLLSLWVDKCRPPVCCNLVLSGHYLIQNPMYLCMSMCK